VLRAWEKSATRKNYLIVTNTSKANRLPRLSGAEIPILPLPEAAIAERRKAVIGRRADVA
jgi:hypothetical protein